MAFEVNYINSYGNIIDNAGLKDNIRLVLNNAAQKTANTAESVFEQNVQCTNSVLLSEYTQMVAKSNAAQQLVLDANLKETLKFLNSEAAKKISKSSKKKNIDFIEEIFTDNDILDYDSNEQTKEGLDFDCLELFDIKVDNSKENIFAA